MFSIDYLKKINNAYGTDCNKQIKINNAQQALKYHFMDSPNFENVKINHCYNQGLLVYQSNNTDFTVKKIRSFPGEYFSVGDIVSCYGCDYIITSIDPNTNIQLVGIMEECNHILKFYDVETDEIVSIDCIIDNSSSNSTLNERNDIAEPNQIRRIRLPSNNLSEKITYDQRFILGKVNDVGIVYRVIGFDRIAEHHLYGDLLTIIVENCAFDPQIDNLELMVSGYPNKDNLPPPYPFPSPDKEWRIGFDGNSNVRVGGTGKYFYAESQSENPTPVTWEIVAMPED